MTLLSPVLYVALLSPALADKAEELILGSWVNKQKQGDVEIESVLEFKKDGTFTIELKGPATFKLGGKYKVLDEGNLELEVKQGDKTDKKKGKFKVSKDKLSLIDDSGKATDFTRPAK